MVGKSRCDVPTTRFRAFASGAEQTGTERGILRETW